jgi:hypothetical protein
LLTRVAELTAGQRIASAWQCSSALIKRLLFDDDPRVFEALLLNQRVREDVSSRRRAHRGRIRNRSCSSVPT